MADDEMNAILDSFAKRAEKSRRIYNERAASFRLSLETIDASNRKEQHRIQYVDTSLQPTTEVQTLGEWYDHIRTEQLEISLANARSMYRNGLKSEYNHETDRLSEEAVRRFPTWRDMVCTLDYKREGLMVTVPIGKRNMDEEANKQTAINDELLALKSEIRQLHGEVGMVSQLLRDKSRLQAQVVELQGQVMSAEQHTREDMERVQSLCDDVDEETKKKIKQLFLYVK